MVGVIVFVTVGVMVGVFVMVIVGVVVGVTIKVGVIDGVGLGKTGATYTRTPDIVGDFISIAPLHALTGGRELPVVNFPYPASFSTIMSKYPTVFGICGKVKPI